MDNEPKTQQEMADYRLREMAAGMAEALICNAPTRAAEEFVAQMTRLVTLAAEDLTGIAAGEQPKGTPAEP